MLRLIAQQQLDANAKPLAVADGGTGYKTASAALQALDAVPAADIGQASGPIPLDQNAKIPAIFLPAMPTVDAESIYGPPQAFCSVLTKYWLSDFDIGTTYNVSCTQGTVTRSGNEIRYTPPATPGSYGFTVNDRFFAVTAIQIYIEKPTFDIHINAKNVTLTLHALVTHGNTGAHDHTDWEISDTNLFSTILFSASNIPTYKDTFYCQIDTPTTVFYARVRVYSQLGFMSGWSDPIQFTSPDAFYPFLQIPGFGMDGIASPLATALDYAGDKLYLGVEKFNNNAGGMFPIGIVGKTTTAYGGQSFGEGALGGRKVSISNDGKKVCSLEARTSGVIRVWYYGDAFNNITSTQLSTVNQFGADSVIDLSGDGDRVIAGNYHFTPTVKAVVYKGTYVNPTYYTWAVEANLTPTDGDDTFEFGKSVAISKDGTYAVVGAPYATNGSAVRTGAVYIFKRTGTSWAQEAKIVSDNPSIGVVNAFFGSSVDIDATGTRIVVAASGENSWSVYVRSGTTWSMEHEGGYIGNSDNQFSTGPVAISDAGDKIVVGYPYVTTAAVAEAGKVDVFLKQNSVWNNVKTFARSAPQFQNWYGNKLSLSGDGNTLAISYETEFAVDPIPLDIFI
jgi:hypothetical protein